MSQENVEVVRRALTAFEDRGVDGVAEYWDPDIDWRAIEGAPDDIGVFSGRDAMRRYYEQWYEMFDDLRGHAEELIDAGDDRVVGVTHVTARMKGSDAEVDMRLAIVYTVQNGVIVRGREYATREQALEAAGLRE
jgi:ketosteroid isomerase-like protein